MKGILICDIVVLDLSQKVRLSILQDDFIDNLAEDNTFLYYQLAGRDRKYHHENQKFQKQADNLGIL